MMLNFEKKLVKRQQSGNLRSLQLIPPLIDFSSNDYLGLARSSKLAKAVLRECRTQLGHLNGLGSTGSRLLTGNSIYAQDLEDRIAQFHGYEAGLLFNCGYMANVGLLSAIANEEDTIIFDAAIHASTHDGIRLSRARALPFRHNDLEHLENRLKRSSLQGDRFICIESIYSTDGSCAPLIDICRITRQYEASLIVDEAHSVGVCGPEGRGFVAKYNLTNHIFAQIVTFGKALGTYGAIILGNNTLKQALINFATSYIYTTALPFQTLAAIKCSYDLFPEMKNERQHLSNLIQFFCNHHCSFSKTHIQSLPIKGNEIIKNMAQNLKKQGFDVRPLLSPTVRQGHEVLRICLHAFNSENELISLISQIKSYRGLKDV